MAAENSLDFAFDKIDLDLGFVMGCFREVLDELGECALASRLPWIDHTDVMSTGQATGKATPGTPAARSLFPLAATDHPLPTLLVCDDN